MNANDIVPYEVLEVTLEVGTNTKLEHKAVRDQEPALEHTNIWTTGTR